VRHGDKSDEHVLFNWTGSVSSDKSRSIGLLIMNTTNDTKLFILVYKKTLCKGHIVSSMYLTHRHHLVTGRLPSLVRTPGTIYLTQSKIRLLTFFSSKSC